MTVVPNSHVWDSKNEIRQTDRSTKQREEIWKEVDTNKAIQRPKFLAWAYLSPGSILPEAVENYKANLTLHI